VTRAGWQIGIRQVHGCNFVAASRMGEGMTWATDFVGKLGKAVALDLNLDQDKVIGSK
jgi:hypothetical protein